jgi:hypothetical protein
LGIAVDGDDNVWVSNSRSICPAMCGRSTTGAGLDPDHPGCYEIVAYVGAAAPLRTPLIGPLVPLLRLQR